MAESKILIRWNKLAESLKKGMSEEDTYSLDSSGNIPALEIDKSKDHNLEINTSLTNDTFRLSISWLFGPNKTNGKLYVGIVIINNWREKIKLKNFSAAFADAFGT